MRCLDVLELFIVDGHEIQSNELLGILKLNYYHGNIETKQYKVR